MGRPRKRRRDEASAPSEQTRAKPSEPISVNVSSPFGDYGMLSPPPALNNFSGFSDFQGHNGLSDSHVSVLHDDSALADFYGNEHSHLDFSMDPMIDPSLWNALPSGAKNDSAIALPPTQQQETPCTCLSVMYLTITDLQTISSFAFPAVVVPLRRAMTTASSLLQCERCPKEPFTAIQNVQSLTALLSALAERFHKVLQEVDAEASRLEHTGAKKLFRVRENNPATHHLHTGEMDCPMGFDIELEGKDWKRLVKKAVRTEVMGGGTNPNPLSLLLDLMEQRQRHWHSSHANMGKLDERIRIFGVQNACSPRGEDAMCLRMVASVRAMVDHMQWE